jgi:hypothetical protein
MSGGERILNSGFGEKALVSVDPEPLLKNPSPTSVAEEKKNYEEYMQDMENKLDKCVAAVNLKRDYLQGLLAQLDGRFSDVKKRGRINIGGQYFDIKRSTIVEDRSFLIALFQPRWEKYLLKDKNGKIYLEYEFEWMMVEFHFKKWWSSQRTRGRE